MNIQYYHYHWLNKQNVMKHNPDCNPNNHLFGKIVCSCEQVTVGEILDVIHRSVPINSIRAIKKRTRAGFGRCQGGFCQPIIASILSQETGKDITEILYSEIDSNILKERAK